MVRAMRDEMRARARKLGRTVEREVIALLEEQCGSDLLAALDSGAILTTELCAKITPGVSSAETVLRRCQEREEEGERIARKVGNTLAGYRLSRWLREVKAWKGEHGRLEAESALRASFVGQPTKIDAKCG